MSPRPSLRSLRRAFRTVWHTRRAFGGTRDWLAHYYNGVVNRSPLPLPGRGATWKLRVRGLDRPVLVRQGSDDWSVLREVLLSGEYGFAVDRLRREDVRQVVDLGANVGYTVRLWRQLFPAARVIAVEPAAEGAAMCRANAALAGDGDAVCCLAVAAGGEPGTRCLAHAAAPMLRSLRSEPGGGDAVPVLRVEEILERGGSRPVVDLVKCDIEGGEREVFADCRAWIGRVRWLLIELHDGYDVPALCDDLARGGSRAEVVARRSKRLRGGSCAELALLRLENGDAPPLRSASPSG